MKGDSRAGLPSVHSRQQLEFMLELGRAQGWFGPMKGVYLGLRLELEVETGSRAPQCFSFRRENAVRQARPGLE